MAEPKVAIVCDWLTNFGGAERVIEQFHQMFLEAPIYTSLYAEDKMPGFENAKIITSYLQKIPGAKRKHQLFLSFYPGAFEGFDLSDFDIVLSSSHSCAKGVITKPSTMHVSYCHSPMRYAWDESHSYIKEYPFNSLAKRLVPHMMHKLRMWDRMAADRVDFYIANSEVVKKRIEKYYQRDSVVIHPPVDVSKWAFSDEDGEYFFAVGRMTPYKRFDLLVDAFNENGLPLKLAGTGPEFDSLKSKAAENIEFLGRVSDEDLLKLYQGAKAFLFPQYEDFGITPLEAMSCGRPVIAYGAGGSLDTVIDGKTGIFFDDQTKESLISAIDEFEAREWNHNMIRKHAEGFDISIFRKEIFDFINSKWGEWCETMR